MTNPDDWWRHQASAQPSAQPHDRILPGMPLQSPGGSDPLLGAGAEPVAYTGPVNPVLMSLELRFFAIIFVLLFSPLIFGTLYPLATGAAFAVSFATDRLLRVAAPILGPDDRLPIIMVVGLVAFWQLSRFDHRLAAVAPLYRRLRHIVRVVLIAIAVTLIALNPAKGLLPHTPAQLRMAMGNAAFLPMLPIVAFLAHRLLTRATGIRARWDRGLEFFRLRPR